MRRTDPKKIEVPGHSPNTSATGRSKYTIAFFTVAAVIIGMLSWAYATHFDNPFEFDDDHTIERNPSLDTLDIQLFFTDASTFSVLPSNQAWRPGITIVNSIDTIRSGGVPDPVKFHQHIFASYILLGILIYFMLLGLVKKVFPEVKWANMAALLATGFFMLHTANAETVNYIISRSDIISTLFVVLAFVLFMYSEVCRNYLLYLIPMLVGYLFKETTIMFAPLLLVFCLLFTPSVRKDLLGIILAFASAAAMFFIGKGMTGSEWNSGGGDPFLYLCTQAFVIVHYFFTFILPMSLSVDTDWTYVMSPFDTRVLAGAAFIIALLVLAIRWSRKPETRLAAFGIFWFFIALAPTSSIFPFAEVLNDHRIFFPFIGLVMVALNFGVLLFRRYELAGKPVMRAAILGFVGLLMIAHTIGTRQRCEVWGSSETLWKDATEKSPLNGRAWMNYGLALMRHNTDSALIAFHKTADLMPGYVYGHVNLAIAYNLKGNLAEAQNHYTIAMNCDSTNPEALYFYGQWLLQQNRVEEGLRTLRAGLYHSPRHPAINQLLAAWSGSDAGSSLQLALERADKDPTPENLLALSLEWYNAGEYLQCALTAEKAAQIRPDYNLAWNNVCAGYNKVGEFDKAVAAGKKAVELAPADQLSNGNLAAALSEQARFKQLTDAATTAPAYDKWILLSLEWYKVNNFRKSLEAAEEAVKMNPNDATGYNNVCAAANRVGEFDRAIEAGEKAVALRPEWELAKNNLAEAKRLKGTK
jgi:tetratricopeptide (TPR) repeat protein